MAQALGAGLRQQISQRGIEAVEVKDEALRLRPRRQRPLAAEQQTGQFAKAQLEHRRRHRQQRRTMQRPAQGTGKIGVAHRLWRAGIVGAARLWLMQKKIYQADLVIDVSIYVIYC